MSNTQRKLTRQDMVSRMKQRSLLFLSHSTDTQEASRLVFVYVRDAKPKRKVAVPVPEGLTWAEFINATRSKLRVSGVKDVFLASSGQRVTSLDELQDIDELCVVEGPEPSSPIPMLLASEANIRSGLSAPSSSASDAIYKTPESRKVLVHDLRSGLGGPGHSSSSSPGATTDDDEGKYRGRIHPLKKLLKKLFPSLFSSGQGLPVTSDDARQAGSDIIRQASGAHSRRRRGGPAKKGMKTLWLMLFLGALVCLFLFQILFWNMHVSKSTAAVS